MRLEQIKAGVSGSIPTTGLQLANTGNLIRTCVIEAVLAAVVITVSVVRRRRHRTRHTAATQA